MKKKINKNALLTAMQTKDTFTENGAVSHSTTNSSVLDFFSKAGALRGSTDQEIINYFDAAYKEDKNLALKALFWAGDVRGGAGERRLFRVLINWLAKNDNEIVAQLIKYIPEYTRFDNILESLEGTPVEKEALKFIKAQLNADLKSETPSILAKWLPSEQASSVNTRRLAKKTREYLKLSPKNYRKTLSALREKINVVERLMCGGKWKKINFSHVPSRAAMIYKAAFNKHTPDLYSKFLTKVEKGEAKINSSVLYPYDITAQILGASGNDQRTLEAQWKALPNYCDGDFYNAICVLDLSGSMDSGYNSSNVKPVDVAVSLGIYFAERNEGAFKDYFITFSRDAKLVKIVGSSLKEKVINVLRDREVANTNLESVFNLILDKAVDNDVPESEMPRKIFLITDCQFDAIVENPNQTNLEAIKRKYKIVGYRVPEIVFWNVNAQKDSAAKADDKGVAMVSGCSPAILKTALSGKIVTPYQTMLEVLNSERYEPIIA